MRTAVLALGALAFLGAPAQAECPYGSFPRRAFMVLSLMGFQILGFSLHRFLESPNRLAQAVPQLWKTL